MNLENLHGVGYYSNRRNEGYQTRYIAAMKENEAVVKREDIYQSFPVLIEFEELKHSKYKDNVEEKGKGENFGDPYGGTSTS